MEKIDQLASFYEAYQQSINDIESYHTFPEYFYDRFLAGQSTIYQKNITETKTFDEEWIRTVESYFPSLNKISLDPKSVLKYMEDVVVVEKARKINSASVRHLAANTQYIREIREDMIIPSKILTTYAELEYGTYENRMVMTLIEKLFLFVRHRYEIIKNNVESFQSKHFKLSSEFPFTDSTVTLDLNITIKEDLDNKKVNEYNKNLLLRVETLNKLVSGLRSSEFMQKMAGQKKVYAPLMKSNVILKNTDYRNAYMLWLFLDRYNTLTYDLDVKEKNLTFDQAYLEDIYQSTLINFTTIAFNQANRKPLYDLIKDKKYRRKGLKVIKRHPDDLVVNPDPIEVEDVTINQYYLEKYKDLFKKSLDFHEADAKTYETSLKRALRDTLQITNALYETFFELDQEDDVFRRLIKDYDPVVELREAKEKALIAKMIREVKAVDYRDAIRQEKRLLNQIAQTDRKLIAAAKKEKLVTSRKVRSVESLKRERDLAERRKKALDDQQAITSKSDDAMDALRKKVNDEIAQLQRDLKEKEASELKAVKEDLRAKLQEERKKLADSYKEERAKVLLKAKKEKERLQKLEANRKKALKVKSSEALKKKKSALQKAHQKSLADEKKKHDAKLKGLNKLK